MSSEDEREPILEEESQSLLQEVDEATDQKGLWNTTDTENLGRKLLVGFYWIVEDHIACEFL
jgi:hypothetical protein